MSSNATLVFDGCNWAAVEILFGSEHQNPVFKMNQANMNQKLTSHSI